MGLFGGLVTGGYPVIAVATDAALDLLAQARPYARAGPLRPRDRVIITA